MQYPPLPLSVLYICNAPQLLSISMLSHLYHSLPFTTPHCPCVYSNILNDILIVVVVILFWQFQSVHCTPKFFRRISAPCSTGRPLIGWSKDIWGEMDGANNIWTIIISCLISIQCWIGHIRLDGHLESKWPSNLIWPNSALNWYKTTDDDGS